MLLNQVGLNPGLANLIGLPHRVILLLVTQTFSEQLDCAVAIATAAL